MKRCPECRRDYFDDTLSFCLEDGTPLVHGVSADKIPTDEPATAVLHSTHPPVDSNTRQQIITTGETVMFPRTGNVLLQNRGVIVALVTLASVLGFATYRYYETAATTSAPTFEKAKITKLTKSTKVITTAISPDGKYFAHVISDVGQQALFVRQTSANNDIPVIPLAPVEYWGITFSKDSNDLFYVTRNQQSPGQLYRMPALGGTPQKIMERLDSPVSFSPDGKRFAFVRGDFPQQGESALLTANSDGTDEKVLAVRKVPERFYPIYFAGPSWSPDGKSIAATVAGIGNSERSKVIAVNVNDGSETDLTKQEWESIGRVEWLADGKGLAMIARDQTALSNQVWHVSVPSGEARQITNDFSEYRSLSSTADSTKLVTAQIARLSEAWVGPASDIEQGRPITPVIPDGVVEMAWTPDGKIVHANGGIGKSDIWIMGSDGGGQRQLTATGNNRSPSVSPDGSQIVFLSGRSGPYNVWIMGIDGSDPRQLTHGSSYVNAVFSADGKWILFSSLLPGSAGISKVSVEGGDPVRLAEGNYGGLAVSPDGKFIAAKYVGNRRSADQRPDKIAILPIDGGVPIKSFGIQPNPSSAILVIWSADGKSLMFNQVRDSVANLWNQPLDGGAPKQISDFKEGLIVSLALSRDGKQLAFSRGSFSRDAVLISSGN